eukprot:gene17099-25959_t
MEDSWGSDGEADVDAQLQGALSAVVAGAAFNGGSTELEAWGEADVVDDGDLAAAADANNTAGADTVAVTARSPAAAAVARGRTEAEAALAGVANENYTAGIQLTHAFPDGALRLPTPYAAAVQCSKSQEQHGEAYSDKLRGILSQLAVETSTSVKYSRDGVKVGTTLYPFPQPKYMTQLIKWCYDGFGGPKAPLLKVLARPRTHHAKEISETLGMLSGMRRGLDAAPGMSYKKACSQPVHVYVPGDGRKPFSAAAVCLRSPPSWKVWSIDPLMEDHFLTGPEDPKHPLGVHAARMTCVNGLSQDFMIPESSPASAPK